MFTFSLSPINVINKKFKLCILYIYFYIFRPELKEFVAIYLMMMMMMMIAQVIWWLDEKWEIAAEAGAAA